MDTILILFLFLTPKSDRSCLVKNNSSILNEFQLYYLFKMIQSVIKKSNFNHFFAKRNDEPCLFSQNHYFSCFCSLIKVKIQQLGGNKNNIQVIIIINRPLMLTPTYPLDYCSQYIQLQPTTPVFYSYILPYNLQILMSETERLRQEQATLWFELHQAQTLKEQMRKDNEGLREQSQKKESQFKRKYRKRRVWLQKKYRCNIKGCRSKYSSKIALNSHKRKKHPKRSTKTQ